eukprot:Awhi_evm1s15049
MKIYQFVASVVALVGSVSGKATRDMGSGHNPCNDSNFYYRWSNRGDYQISSAHWDVFERAIYRFNCVITGHNSIGTSFAQINLEVKSFFGPDSQKYGKAFAYAKDLRYGKVEINVAKLDELYQNGKLESLIMHEIGHAVGIGLFWDDKLPDGQPCGTYYRGTKANNQYDNVLNLPNSLRVVNPESTAGGSGTGCYHFNNQYIGSEVMTSTIQKDMSLSRITVGSLEDLGFNVDYSAADSL